MVARAFRDGRRVWQAARFALAASTGRPRSFVIAAALGRPRRGFAKAASLDRSNVLRWLPRLVGREFCDAAPLSRTPRAHVTMSNSHHRGVAQW